MVGTTTVDTIFLIELLEFLFFHFQSHIFFGYFLILSFFSNVLIIFEAILRVKFFVIIAKNINHKNYNKIITCDLQY